MYAQLQADVGQDASTRVHEKEQLAPDALDVNHVLIITHLVMGETQAGVLSQQATVEIGLVFQQPKSHAKLLILITSGVSVP